MNSGTEGKLVLKVYFPSNSVLLETVVVVVVEGGGADTLVLEVGTLEGGGAGLEGGGAGLAGGGAGLLAEGKAGGGVDFCSTGASASAVVATRVGGLGGGALGC